MITPQLSVSFHTPKRILNGVRLIAKVASHSRRNLKHTVLFIDGTFRGRRRRAVVCNCEDFLYRREGRLRSCIHTRNAKRERKADHQQAVNRRLRKDG